MTKHNPTRHILVQEEYGYRHWIGTFPVEMTVESVIDWWKSLQSVAVMFFNPSQAFPMPLYELKDVAPDDAEVAIFQWKDSEGQIHILDRKNIVLFAHTHEDDDSYMKIPKGETFYHAGYEEYPPTDEHLKNLAKIKGY